MSKLPQVKNRAPAPIQITAEQILREAKDRGLEDAPKPPKQFITDADELRLHQQTKRKDFEDQIRRQRHKIGVWCKYALWEASLKEFERARSVFERALDIDYRNQTVWLKYAEMEMKNKFINHARNIWDRCVTLLPRVDIFWFKYTYMEEMVGAIEEARQVFERWMKWEPMDMSWHAFIKFEMRQGQIVRAREIYERYVKCFPTSRGYLKYAKWEEYQNQLSLARNVYERALEEVHSTERSIKLIVNFARFEERCKEFDRARVIYRYALEETKGTIEELDELKQEFLGFEKRHGSREDIEDVILNRRRSQYEEILRVDCYNYDAWFDFIRLEEAEGHDIDKIRNIYDRAVGNVPPIVEKRYWKRYMYLWINYALFEELHAKDIARTRTVYNSALKVIPHKSFTFGKIWILASQFEVRQRDLIAARRIFGQAIGMAGKENIFKGYIELELQLGEVERCRVIYGKYIEMMPFNSNAWKSFAQLEINVGETERARGIYDLAISQPEMDMPELLWKAFIDFEISEGEFDKSRALFEKLLRKTSHVKVWISYAQFEASLVVDESNDAKTARDLKLTREIFTRGYAFLKQQGLKEERLLLLESWREAEVQASSSKENLIAVESKFPRKIKMRRPVLAEDGSGRETGWEEYYDYQFPDDDKKIVGLKLLENAMKWKLAAAAMAASGNASVVTAESELEAIVDGDNINEDVDEVTVKVGLETPKAGEDSNEMNISDDEFS